MSNYFQNIIRKALGFNSRSSKPKKRTRLGATNGASNPPEQDAMPSSHLSSRNDLRSDDILPKIPVRDRQLRDISKDALKALEKANVPPKLFVRSGVIVQIRCDEHQHPFIEIVSENILKGKLDRAADFCDKDNDAAISKYPPDAVVKDILALGAWNFPTLEGVVSSPTLRPDGSILLKKGYDQITGLYYFPSSELGMVYIPDQPTPTQVKDALAILQEAIDDFPFADDASRANALALLLTPIVRPAINGNVPLVLIDAPQAGTGKTLLSKIVSITAVGHINTLTTAPKDPDEWRKKITSLLSEGAAVVVIDNIVDIIDSEFLAAALTSETWNDRLLGKNTILRLPQRATWIATGNNIRLGGDLPRRCYLIRLDAQSSRPWQRGGFLHQDLQAWAVQNRGRLISAGLTLARAWYAEGKPAFQGQRIGGFTEWANIIGGILRVAGVSGFLANVENMYKSSDDDSGQWEPFLLAIHKQFSDREIKAVDISQAILQNNIPVDSIPDTLGDPFGNKIEMDSRFINKLGRELKKITDKRFGDSQVRVVKSFDPHSKVSLWSIVREDYGDRFPLNQENQNGDSQETLKAALQVEPESFPSPASPENTTYTPVLNGTDNLMRADG